MNPVDLIVITVIIGIAALSGWYIYKSKKSGKKCIGCPDAGRCSGSCVGCSCGCNAKEQ